MTMLREQLRALVDEAPGELPPLTEELVRSLDLDLPAGAHLSIAEVADQTGVSAHTLRYYERAGLVQVGRDAGGRRSYDRHALGRVIFISRLRASDMPIRAIERYVRLVEEGDATVPERLRILEEHRVEILRRVGDLQFALAVVDYKIATYGGSCQ